MAYDIDTIRLWTNRRPRALGQPGACQLLGILLWMHNGLGYIYVKPRVKRDETGPSCQAGRGCAPKGPGAMHPEKEVNMSIEQFIDNEVKSNDVVLFMKGTPQFPQCGFSGQVVQIHEQHDVVRLHFVVDELFD